MFGPKLLASGTSRAVSGLGERSAWWRIDPGTGETLGMLHGANGVGGSITVEQAIHIANVTVSILVGLVCVVYGDGVVRLCLGGVVVGAVGAFPFAAKIAAPALYGVGMLICHALSAKHRRGRPSTVDHTPAQRQRAQDLLNLGSHLEVTRAPSDPEYERYRGPISTEMSSAAIRGPDPRPELAATHSAPHSAPPPTFGVHLRAGGPGGFATKLSPSAAMNCRRASGPPALGSGLR